MNTRIRWLIGIIVGFVMYVMAYKLKVEQRRQLGTYMDPPYNGGISSYVTYYLPNTYKYTNGREGEG